MDFKAQLQRDLDVFHNSGEFAQQLEFWYDGNRYCAPVILDSSMDNRKQPASDHVDGIYRADLTMHIAHEAIKVIPRKGHNIEIGDDTYIITHVSHEDGDIVIEMEMLTE